MKGGVCNTTAPSNCVGNSQPSKGILRHLPGREINFLLLTFALILSEKPKWTDTISSYFTFGIPGGMFRYIKFTYGTYI